MIIMPSPCRLDIYIEHRKCPTYLVSKTQTTIIKKPPLIFAVPEIQIIACLLFLLLKNEMNEYVIMNVADGGKGRRVFGWNDDYALVEYGSSWNMFVTQVKYQLANIQNRIVCWCFFFHASFILTGTAENLYFFRMKPKRSEYERWHNEQRATTK